MPLLTLHSGKLALEQIYLLMEVIKKCLCSQTCENQWTCAYQMCVYGKEYGDSLSIGSYLLSVRIKTTFYGSVLYLAQC